MKTITTERLMLTPWKLSDAADLFSYAKNPNVGSAAGWAPHRTIFDSVHLITAVLKPQGVFCIRPKETGRAIGTISLSEDKYRPGIRSMELGYSMDENYWGRGLMTEAVRAVMKHGFGNLGLDRICVCTGPENGGSQNIINKCGFTYEGTLRQAFRVYDGSIRDVMCFSISCEEYYSMIED